MDAEEGGILLTEKSEIEAPACRRYTQSSINFSQEILRAKRENPSLVGEAAATILNRTHAERNLLTRDMLGALIATVRNCVTRLRPKEVTRSDVFVGH